MLKTHGEKWFESIWYQELIEFLIIKLKFKEREFRIWEMKGKWGTFQKASHSTGEKCRLNKVTKQEREFLEK